MLNKDKVSLAIAPIAWTNDDLPDLGAENTFEQCVSEMALSGFKGSEIGNKYPKDVETLKHKLDVRGLPHPQRVVLISPSLRRLRSNNRSFHQAQRFSLRSRRKGYRRFRAG